MVEILARQEEQVTVYKYSDLTLRETLIFLKSQIEQVSPENLKCMYRKSILPHLLQIRRQNRQEKNNLESKFEKAKELNQKLINLQEACDCLSYKASCLKFEVSSVKEQAKSSEIIAMDTDSANNDELMNYRFDVNAVAQLDHESRMRQLDEEETKRKELLERLKKIEDETKTIENACSQSENKLNQVKPPIRQLLEKVEPILQINKPV